jgi:urease subunit alpha
MGQSPSAPEIDNVLDLVITNDNMLDSWGIVKGDIGIKDGKIVAIGKAGNPGMWMRLARYDNWCIYRGHCGEGLIALGGIDTHIHFICPQQIETALYSCITTMLAENGTADGTNATTCTPGSFNIQKIWRLQRTSDESWVSAKGNASFEGFDRADRTGAMSLKLHEDWGTTPKAIDTCLN